jgi:hypothetical protein
MLRSLPITRAWGAVAVALTIGFAIPEAAQAENKKHHLSLGLGYQKYLSDDMKPVIDIDPGPATDLREFDFTNAGAGFFAYRLSIKPNLDFTVDSRAAISSEDVFGTDVTVTTTYFGPGLRFISSKEGIRPYFQANFLVVSEELEIDLGNNNSFNSSETGVGFGVSAGIDIRGGNLLSIPIEAFYVYGKPEDDVSSVGVCAGLTFNFGTLK